MSWQGVAWSIAFAFVTGCSGGSYISQGEQLFAENCAICHGLDARGGGGANVPGLGKTPPDLTLLLRERGGSFPRDEFLNVLRGYEDGTHPGRRMRPFDALSEGRNRRVKTADARVSVPQAQAALLAYLEAVQRP